MSNQASKKRLLIVGGGFAGVRCALLLSKRKNLQVTLISDSDTFTYYPQLYHAATGGSRSETAIPLQDLFRDKPVTVVHDTVTAIDHAAHKLTTLSKITYEYDDAILALGSITNYFG